ncbi:hypothetical protein [Pseudomonas marginalis]|uniref:hypothetical protein n=1 Tax=Pseudomonas marginalis TaxID=298 RepID=UPI002B1CDF6D|nr:hypothetical protein [Pseudomonas marginalis]
MNTHVLLSFDLKQNTTTVHRDLFDERLEGCGWKDCPDVSSAKTKAFSGGDAEESKIIAIMEIFEAALHARIKETSFVIQCGNLEPVSKTFLHPKFKKLLSERLGLLS